VTYYDNYANCSPCQDSNYAFVSESWGTTTNEPYQNVTNVNGRIVGSGVKILGTTNTWLNTVVYYNRFGQPIQTIGGNHLGGRDRISTLVDFTGRTQRELQTAIGYNNGGVSTLLKVYTYDPMGRLKILQHQINSQPMVTLSSLSYNELSQLTNKTWPLIPSSNSNGTGESIDYRYNIRGWLTNLNNLSNDDPNDYFGMDLTFNSTLTGAGNTPRYDGMISALRWKQDLSTKKRVYNFAYDGLNRVSSSSEKMDPNSANTWSGEPDFYTESGFTYDLNGNIKTLSRNMDYYSGSNNANSGTIGSFNSAEQIDQLSYTYPSTGGNQLMQVSDAASSSYKQFGFADGTNTGYDYHYDANGNLISDQNKKISSISYYFNNRVNRVSLNDGFNSYIQYTYDAAGIKLNEFRYIYDLTPTSPTYQTYVTNSTDYIGNFVLLNGQVLSINHPQGRITAPTYENIISNPDAGSLDGFGITSSNVVLSSVYQNSQTYVTATNNQGTLNEGVFPISTTKGSSFPVVPGQTYSFKVLGYQTSGAAASLYVTSNAGDLTWPGTSLPTGSASENWVTVSITNIPQNVTSISLGVKWNGSAAGNTIYINRVALYKTDFEYNFFMKDQVGSTRVVLQTNPGTQLYTATMEAQNQSTESSQFQNMSGSAITQMVASPGNHTPGGSYAFKLNGAFPVGPGKSIKVYPGDKVDASAYSYFVNTSGYSAVTSVGQAVATTFGGAASTLGDPGAIYSNVTNIYAAGGALAGHTGSSSYPSAYLNYILFDKDFNPITTLDPNSGLGRCGSVPISQTPNSVQQVSMHTITASEIGYLYVYLSYENTNTNTGAEVYFDDFKITVQESPVIQVNSYYPFGLRSYTWLRGGETDNAFLYQGKELLAQTGWHDFGSRMYAAELGRWFAQDPQKEFASPYLAMGNAPMRFSDPNGENVFDDIGNAFHNFGDWYGKEMAQFDSWSRENDFYKKSIEVVAAVAIAVVTDGIGDVVLFGSETAGAVAVGAATGAAIGAATGFIEGHTGNEFWDDVAIGAIGGAAFGAADDLLGEANTLSGKLTNASIKGASSGFASGVATGVREGGHSFLQDIGMGITDAITSGAITTAGEFAEDYFFRLSNKGASDKSNKGDPEEVSKETGPVSVKAKENFKFEWKGYLKSKTWEMDSRYFDFDLKVNYNNFIGKLANETTQNIWYTFDPGFNNRVNNSLFSFQGFQ
jgi:RHS repeat-associated protein